ncbi:hypothetical protein ACH5RR_023566 [Cinchona calisaya]|uniref:Uncharacterized protein n=1 Tax=Cinchona calisaya TaxID=153742 RepID=A0ABD2ZC47_9GENT
MARGRGPSPLVPALMVVVLSVIIFWPYIYFIAVTFVPWFQSGADADDAGSSTSLMVQLLLVFLMFLIRFLTASNPKASYGRKWQSSRYSYGYNDGEGFGLGALLLLLIFLVLYNLM